MRIVLTGVSGQVGRALLPRLRIHDVVPLDVAALDLAETTQIAGVLERQKPELIINAAAYTAVDKAESEPDRAYLVNATAPAAMANWAAQRDVPLVHFSTDYVFDGSGNRRWREDDAPKPLSVYGASKYAGDAAIRGAGGVSLIVRTSWVYAAEGVNFLRTITRLARERKDLRVVDDQIGAPTSAPLIADIVADMLVQSSEAFRRHCARANGLVNVTASGETSWHGFATAIVDGLRARGVPLAVERVLPISTEDYPTPAKRPRNSRLDLSPLREVFGVVPRPCHDALNDELDLLARSLQ